MKENIKVTLVVIAMVLVTLVGMKKMGDINKEMREGAARQEQLQHEHDALTKGYSWNHK